MLLMVLAYVNKLPTPIVVALYLFRTSTINSTGALTKSVLMDNVPRKERGKWAALDSVNMMSWSGSAALGGFLVGLEGILFNFTITASIQILGTLPLVFLWSKEKMEGTTQEQQQQGAGGAASATATESNGVSTEPLLSEQCQDGTKKATGQGNLGDNDKNDDGEEVAV